ncbi:MAG: amino acid ABC transporter permease [Eggerthellaceae bacterium]|nr:amino acid ABC transporter permease [Eggerthellaceae bacterium]
MVQLLLTGFGVTMAIFFVTLVGSIPLGVVFAFCRLSKLKPLELLTRAIISILRGTPLMLQLMAILFASYYVFGIQVNCTWKLWACAIGFIVNYAAYFAEIYRGGFQSIPVSQFEAARMLGYSASKSFSRIILPQLFKRIMPAMGNEIIILVKDTSLAFVLGIVEMFSQAKIIAASEVSILPYIAAGFIYWVVGMILVAVLNRLEKKYDYYKE